MHVARLKWAIYIPDIKAHSCAHKHTQEGRMILFPWEGVLCLRLMLLASNYLKSILGSGPEISACQHTSDGAAANQRPVKANKNRLECSLIFSIPNSETFDSCRHRTLNRISTVSTQQFAADPLGKHLESDRLSSNHRNSLTLVNNATSNFPPLSLLSQRRQE